MGECYYAQGKYEESIKSFNDSIKLSKEEYKLEQLIKIRKRINLKCRLNNKMKVFLDDLNSKIFKLKNPSLLDELKINEELYEKIYVLSGIIEKILYSYIFYIEEKKRIIHYTRIDTIKNLFNFSNDNTPKFRLYNSIYMNDPNEGEIFKDMLKYVDKKMNKEENNNIIF